MKKEHGVVLTLSADEQLAISALIAMKFQARAPAVPAPAQTGHELGERAFFHKELALAVAAPEFGQLTMFGGLTLTCIAIRIETIPFATGATGAAPLGCEFDKPGLGIRHDSSV